MVLKDKKQLFDQVEVVTSSLDSRTQEVQRLAQEQQNHIRRFSEQQQKTQRLEGALEKVSVGKLHFRNLYDIFA